MMNSDYPRVGVSLTTNTLSLADVQLLIGGWAIARALDADFVICHPSLPAITEQLEWLNIDWDDEASSPESAELTHILPETIALPELTETDTIDHLQTMGYLPSAIWSLIIHRLNPQYPEGLITKWDTRKQFQIDAIPTESTPISWETADQLNKLAIQKLPQAELCQLAIDQLEDTYGMRMNRDWISKLVEAVKPELQRIEQLIDLTEWAFDPPPAMSKEGMAQLVSADAAPILTHFLAEVTTVVLLDKSTTATILAGIAERFPTQSIEALITIGLTGSTTTASAETIAGLLGKNRCLERIAFTLKKLRD